MSAAEGSLEHGERFPWDANDAWWHSSNMPPPPSDDWAHRAARGVIADLSARRGIKSALDIGSIDEDVRAEIVRDIADLIRTAAPPTAR